MHSGDNLRKKWWKRQSRGSGPHSPPPRTLYDSKVAGHFHSLKGDVTVDNEDQVGLVTLGSQRSGIPAGSIVVHHRFTVS